MKWGSAGMDYKREFEIFDHQGNCWMCSIFKNESYKDAPSFLRIRCRALNFDKIVESFNDQHTLMRILKFITYYHYIATPEERDPLKLKSTTIMAISNDWHNPVEDVTY